VSLKDAIVVLGCRVARSGKAEGALRRRCERSAQAYHDGIAGQLLVCGGKLWSGRAEATVMRETLETLHVPAAAIHCELRSLTTAGNARFATPILRGLGARRVALVSCDFHLQRALGLFTAAGFECVGLACPSPVRGSRRVLRALAERTFRCWPRRIAWLD
jgi:uncharacterized SAM-binding protein YcdF (DUF218 family)